MKPVVKQLSVPRVSTMIPLMFVLALASALLIRTFEPQPLVLTPAEEYHVREVRAQIKAGKPLKNAIVELRGGVHALVADVAADRSYLKLMVFHYPHGSEIKPAYADLGHVVRTDNTSWMYEIKDVVYPGDKDYPKAREKLLPAD